MLFPLTLVTKLTDTSGLKELVQGGVAHIRVGKKCAYPEINDNKTLTFELPDLSTI